MATTTWLYPVIFNANEVGGPLSRGRFGRHIRQCSTKGLIDMLLAKEPPLPSLPMPWIEPTLGIYMRARDTAQPVKHVPRCVPNSNFNADSMPTVFCVLFDSDIAFSVKQTGPIGSLRSWQGKVLRGTSWPNQSDSMTFGTAKPCPLESIALHQECLPALAANFRDGPFTHGYIIAGVD